MSPPLPRSSGRGLVARLALLVAVALGASCHVDDAAVSNAFYSCDSTATAGDAQCGPGFRCFPAGQLGGSDFCVPSCSETGSAAIQSTSWCVAGYRIATCDDQGGCTSPELTCVRDGLTTPENQGLCLPIASCAHASDCKNPARSACLSSFLEEEYPVEFAKSQPPGSCLSPASFDRPFCDPRNADADCAAGMRCASFLGVGNFGFCVQSCTTATVGTPCTNGPYPQYCFDAKLFGLVPLASGPLCMPADLWSGCDPTSSAPQCLPAGLMHCLPRPSSLAWFPFDYTSYCVQRCSSDADCQQNHFFDDINRFGKLKNYGVCNKSSSPPRRAPRGAMHPAVGPTSARAEAARAAAVSDAKV